MADFVRRFRNSRSDYWPSEPCPDHRPSARLPKSDASQGLDLWGELGTYQPSRAIDELATVSAQVLNFPLIPASCTD